MSLKVFTCTDHAGHWAVGVASVVIAHSEDEAKRLLDVELLANGLDTTPYTLKQVASDHACAIVLNNGEY